jgi:DNA polymerase III subunit epsilon
VKWFGRTPLDAARWVVVDCETSGLNVARDRLLSVGAVAVRAGRIEVAEAFSARVGQAAPSEPQNILIHGIGGDAQRAGQPLEQVLAELQRFMEGAFPAAFHAPFDAGILKRHGLKAGAQWLDLAVLLPALFPEHGAGDSTLDHWLGVFAIPAHARHDALGDAFATAQLLLVALAEAQRQRLATVQALFRAEGAGRWLARR